MTHKDIYTKFVIEYDKANVTSSYPSLTEYEIATVLDKAYNALIAQKVTGNNYRRSVFESDNKAIADLEPLVKSQHWTDTLKDSRVSNSISGKLPPDMLYFITAYMRLYKKLKVSDAPSIIDDPKYDPADGNKTRSLQIKLVSHDMATRFFASPHNIPWVKDPVGYIESGRLHVVYDPVNKPLIEDVLDLEYMPEGYNPSTPVGGSLLPGQTVPGTVTPVEIVYIKLPNTFVKDLMGYDHDNIEYISYFDYKTVDGHEIEDFNFECNSTMAEELVSLAVAFALENVESARLNSKLNMRGLEA